MGKGLLVISAAFGSMFSFACGGGFKSSRFIAPFHRLQPGTSLSDCKFWLKAPAKVALVMLKNFEWLSRRKLCIGQIAGAALSVEWQATFAIKKLRARNNPPVRHNCGDLDGGPGYCFIIVHMFDKLICQMVHNSCDSSQQTSLPFTQPA